MPIRINLKEIFPSDPQEINVDKLNFNFNRLLELGVGTPGPIGLTGPEGPAGPIGLTGPQGDRGATWWVDSGEPSLITFPVGALIDGDLYLDKDNFNVYQYDLATDTWTLQASISTIIQSYLAANGSPFVRNFGSTLDDRFVAFAKRDDNNDLDRGATSLSDNGILFLNNFDETTFSNISNLGEKYTSLLSIYPNHSDSKSSSAADSGRYHIELGSLYKFGDLSDDIQLSNLTQSLKINYARDYVNPAILTNTNDDNWINLAKFSLSDPDGNTSTIDSNSVFQFITSKYNFEGPSAVKDILSTYVGPWESLVEQGPSFEHIQADGITFYLNNSNISSTLGVVTEFTHASTRLDTENFFMLDTDPNMKGILFNREVFAIENVNILAKLSIGDIDPASDLTIKNNASIGDAYKAIVAPTDSLIVSGKIGIGTSTPSVKLHVSNDDELARFEGSTANSFITIVPPQLDGPTDVATLGYLNSYSLELSNGFATGDIIFRTNSSARVWIKPDGKFGIGTSSPGSKLSVNGNVSIGDAYDGLAAPSNGMIVEGNVGIGISVPTEELHVDGTIRVDGNLQMVDGNEESGAVLTSDSQGVGQWTPFSMIGVPVGSIMPYYDVAVALGIPGSAIPDGWLICDGTNISTTPPYAGDPIYDNLRAKLFAGTLPDLRGAFIVGASLPTDLGNGANSDGQRYNLYDTGGEAEVTLTTNQIPAHTHGAGTLQPKANGDNEIIINSDGAYNSLGGNNGTDLNTSGNPDWSDQISGGQQWDLTIDGDTDNGAYDSVEDPQLLGNSHENRPPYFALYYIIKY